MLAERGVVGTSETQQGTCRHLQAQSKVGDNMIDIQQNGFHLQVAVATVLVWALVGLIAGFLASRVMLGHSLGLGMDIVVGILGAFLGGFLADRFGIAVSLGGSALLRNILVAFVGALLLLLVLRLLGSTRRRAAYR